MTITMEKKPTRVTGRSRLAVVAATVAVALVEAGQYWPRSLASSWKPSRERRFTSGECRSSSPRPRCRSCGWGLLALLERRTVNARKVWTVVAAIACITSLGSPLTSGIGIGAKLGLASLHLLVGAATIYGLRRTALSATDRCTPA